jgi:dephospho-CoA kinase
MSDNWGALIIVGLPGSGKSTAARYLADREDAQVVSAGDTVRELARRQGLPDTRVTLQELGAEFLERYGDEAFGELLLKNVNLHKPVIIEGIRPPGVVAYIRRELQASILLFIDASESSCCLRLAYRGVTQEQCQQLLRVPLEREVLSLRDQSDLVIKNDHDIDDFYRSLDRIKY